MLKKKKIKLCRCDCIEGKKKIEEEWERYKDENAILIDVRSLQEYKEGHINGSISIPYYELNKRAEVELLNKGQTILLYCNTGSRSKKAAKLLQEMGYINVVEVCKKIVK